MKTKNWLCFINFYLIIKLGNSWSPDVKSKLYIKYDQEKIPIFFGNTSDYFKILYQDENNMLIGARNAVYNLSLNGLLENFKQRIYWPSLDAHRELCVLKGKQETDCENYIRIFARISEHRIMICGTNSYKPLCRFYNIHSNNIEMDKEIEAQGICPYNPTHNSTYIYTDAQLYTATVADFSGSDPLIYRKTQRTELYDLKQLNQPAFISAVERNGYVFFFFREISMEYMNCGKAIYSRVGRVCKNDKGGPYPFNERWTSFLKSRLNCSMPGDYPFYFDEIQATSKIIDGLYKGDKNSLIYAILTTPINAIGGSAVCAFSINDILNAFEGRFKAQKDINSNWLPIPQDRVPDPRPGQCVDDSRTLPSSSVNFVKTHTLMETAISSFYNKPILTRVSLQYRFTSITVDSQIVALSGKIYDIIFVGTDEGKIIKFINYYSLNKTEIQTNVISEVQGLPAGTVVKDLTVSRKTLSLIVVGNEHIISLPLFDCSRITICRECLLVQDPYCVWDIENHECTSIFNFKKNNQKQFIQDIENPESDLCEKYDNGNSIAPPTLHVVQSSHGTVSSIGRVPHIDNEIPVISVDKSELENAINQNFPLSGPISKGHVAETSQLNLSSISWITGGLALIILGILIGFFIARFYTQNYSAYNQNHNQFNWHHPTAPGVGSVLGGSGVCGLEKSRHMMPARDKDINILMNVSQFSTQQCNNKKDNLDHDFIVSGLGGKDRSSERKNSTESLDKEISQKCPPTSITSFTQSTSPPTTTSTINSNNNNNNSNINSSNNNNINNISNISGGNAINNNLNATNNSNLSTAVTAATNGTNAATTGTLQKVKKTYI